MSYKWVRKMPKQYQLLYRKHWNNCDLLNGGTKCTCDKPKMEDARYIPSGPGEQDSRPAQS